MNSKATGGKSALIREVVKKGFSVRRAERGVNAVFDVITRALWRGESVETPLGTLTVRRRKDQRRQELHTFRDIQTKKTSYKLVRYPGPHRTVKLKADEDVDLTPPPQPKTSEEIECRRLADELLSRPVADAYLARLRQSAALRGSRPGSLLRRLQFIRDRGWKPCSQHQLDLWVKVHDWL
jgi:nucleoid DNA-binding protein